MIRLILRLLRIKDYEVCLSCQTLKEQLAYERAEKQRLTDTLLNIIQPKAIEVPPPIEINQIQQSSALFSRRRAALEARDREEARLLKQSKNIGKPDEDINKLESELGIEQETEKETA